MTNLYGESATGCLASLVDDEVIAMWTRLLQEATCQRMLTGSKLQGSGESGNAAEGCGRRVGRVVYVFHHNFLNNVRVDIRTAQVVLARWLGIPTKYLPIQAVFQVDLLICPVHFDLVHWGVIAFDCANKIIYLLDPMSSAPRAWVADGHFWVLQGVRQFLDLGGENWDDWARRYKCRPPFPLQKDIRNSG